MSATHGRPAYTCRVTRIAVCGARHLQGGKSLRTDVEGDCEESNLIFCLEILFGLLQHMQGRYFLFIIIYFIFLSVLLFSCLFAPTSHLTRYKKKVFFYRKRCQNTLLIWRLGATPPTAPPTPNPPPSHQPAHPPAGTLTDVLHCCLKISTLAL